jgi:hypothetical protein
MYLRVNNSHIQNGIRVDEGSCPIALALTEQLPLPEDHRWAVGSGSLRIQERKACGCCWSDLQSVDLPTRAREFVRKFDRYEPVNPIAIRL